MEKPKNYKIEKRHPCEKHPRGAMVFVAGDKRITIENNESSDVIKDKVLKVLKSQLTYLENTINNPNPDSKIPITETLLNLHTQVNDALERAQNTLGPDEISDLRNKFAELSVQILKLIF